MLLLDEVLELTPGSRVVCLKTIRSDEPFVQGHFPGNPLFPGVLLLEAMAQALLVAHLSALPAAQRHVSLLGAVQSARFFRPVRCGDRLHIEAELERVMGNTGLGRAVIRRGNDRVAKAELGFGGEE